MRDPDHGHRERHGRHDGQARQGQDSALEDFDQAKADLDNAVERQMSTLRELPPEVTDPIEKRIQQDAKDILSVVQSAMIQTVPAVTMEVVTGYGEIWSRRPSRT